LAVDGDSAIMADAVEQTVIRVLLGNG